MGRCRRCRLGGFPVRVVFRVFPPRLGGIAMFVPRSFTRGQGGSPGTEQSITAVEALVVTLRDRPVTCSTRAGPFVNPPH